MLSSSPALLRCRLSILFFICSFPTCPRVYVDIICRALKHKHSPAMASSWQPSCSTRLSDHYRPKPPLDLGRPPRPGPRQPDCWRPGQRLPSPSRTKQKEQKEAKTGGASESSKQLTDKKNSTSSTRNRKATPSELSGSNRVPLGKRQMGMVNSIIRSEEQSVEAAKINENRGDQIKALTIVPEEASEETDSETIKTSAINPFTTEVPRPCLSLQSLFSTTQDSEWPRTKIAAIPSSIPQNTVSTIPSLATSSEHTTSTATSHFTETSTTASSSSPSPPTRRQKLNFGNRVDQCLLKMDKWADAWLSSALITEDPNPNPDNAWQSFEHCLSMPDILEDGEVVEYEEVPRCGLPATEMRLVGLKRIWDGEGLERMVVKNEPDLGRGREGIVSTEPTLPSIVPTKRSRDSTTFFDSSTNDSIRTEFRETKDAEFRSSSPDCKRAKVFHIPSAATLREEARRKILLQR